jgi:type II secretory ATPase GspE/PulE/Tfp pilus assembly ATPase PilB-like protein
MTDDPITHMARMSIRRFPSTHPSTGTADRPGSSARVKRFRLGEVLLRSGTITAEQLSHALAQQQNEPLPLGQLLVKLGYVSDDTVRQALGRQANVSFVDLDRMELDRALARVVNSNYARRHALVPVAQVKQTLTICMDDPTNRSVVEDLQRSTGLTVTVVTSSHDAIGRAQARLYDESAHTSQLDRVDLLVEEAAQKPVRSKYVDEYLQDKKADAIVRRLLSKTISHRASDIHLEPLANRLQVRFRIDGVLEPLDLGDLQEMCDHSAREIVSRLKILAKLDIAERRRPQDGSFRVRVDRGEEQTSVDLRVSVVPSYYGESVVLRLLDRQHAPRSIEELHFPQPITSRLRHLLQRPSGILLVTGPTGSGKTTTLYAALMTIYRPQIRVVTAEDPIEYLYEQFSQSEVNPDIGNTFGSYLRAFLRHDPEVIMVGEIRDEETATMAFRAAQTGHLLLSTVHTETAVAAVPRLLALNVDANSIASSLMGVLGQRLVRRVCQDCRTEYEPPADLMREFFRVRPADLAFRKGAGCQRCNYTGYRGRMTMAELWTPDDEDVLLITKHAAFDELRASSARTTLSMAETMWQALEQGDSNLEELVRVLPTSVIAEFRQRVPPRSGAASA